MAILLVTAEYPPLEGGVGDYTRLLALHLRAQGEAVAVLTSAAAGGRPGDGPEIYPLVRRWGWGCLRTIVRVVRERRPRIVHLQYQTGAYRMHPAIHFLPDALRRLPFPPRLVVTMHDLRVPYLFPKAGRLRQKVVAHLLGGAEAVVVTNGADLLTLAPLPGRREEGEKADPDLLRPLPPGALRRPPVLIPLASSLPTELPACSRPAWRARLGIPPESALLGYFGLLHPSKGADLLVRAAAALRRDGRAVQVLFVGGGSGATDPGNVRFAGALRDEIARLGLAEAVHWSGPCPPEEAAGHLQACDLVVLPFRDGASFRRSSLIAALALGCAVVTTPPAGPAEVWLGEGQPTLVDGENIALAPPEAGALAEAIARLLADETGRGRLAQGAARLGQSFTWGKVGSKTRALYEQIG